MKRRKLIDRARIQAARAEILAAELEAFCAALREANEIDARHRIALKRRAKFRVVK